MWSYTSQKSGAKLVAIKIDGLAKAVTDGLAEYADAVAEDIKAAAAASADSCVDELKKTSPKDTGSYRKGWKKCGTPSTMRRTTNSPICWSSATRSATEAAWRPSRT